MFLRFTKSFSRQKLGFAIALLMLFAPALIATTVESAQKNKAKATPTPKKKTAPTPSKIQAKTKPTPKPTPPVKSKSNSKTTTQTASKNKTAPKKEEKTAASKSNQKTTDKNKNSKTAATKNQKQTPPNDKRTLSKTDKNAKTAKTDKNSSSKTTKSQTTEKNKTAAINTKTKTKTTAETKSKTEKTNKTAVKTTEKTKEKTPETTTEKTSADLPQVIVTTFSVPIKGQAKLDSATLSNAKLGTVLKVTEKNPAWYKVQYSSGGKSANGWISANSVNDLNNSGKTEIYRQIVERNYKPQMDFDSAMEFYDFVSKVDGDLDGSDKSADIELKRLLALRSALKTIPADKRETTPYKEFLKNQDKEIVYNEPAGQWLVASNQFWNLHDKYKKSTVSDNIAWEAANNPLPGECEGYINCYLFDMRMRFGEYLNLHPNGKNAAEALKNMTDYLSPIVADSGSKKIYNGPTDVTDRAEFNNLLAELRTIVARLPFVEKEKALRQIRQIAEAYR